MASSDEKDMGFTRCALAWRGEDPAALLEALMSDERCAALSPCIISSLAPRCSPARGIPFTTTAPAFPKALAELDSRAACVPGATCAKWGVCGAAASCGMAFAVLAGNAPLRREGWSEGQLMVSEVPCPPSPGRGRRSLLQTRFAHRRSHGRPMV